ncbi:MAG: putative bifunctional diguanylate cyclase/phosphodiesterase [Acidimicrobiales bacterium]
MNIEDMVSSVARMVRRRRPPWQPWRDAATNPSSLGDGRTMARSLGVLSVLGPFCAVGQLVLFNSPYRLLTLFVLACAAWAAIGLVLLSGAFDHKGRNVFASLLFLSTALVSVAVYASGARGPSTVFYYLWVTPYAFVFFTRRPARLQVLFVGVCCAVALLAQTLQHPSLGPVSAEVPVLLGLLASLLVIGTLARRLTDRVREVEGRFRQGFDHSPLGLAFVSADGTWLDVNDSLCRIIDRSRDELVGSSMSAVFGDNHLVGLACASVGQSGASEECVDVLRRNDGEEAWMAVTVVKVVPSKGESYFYLQLNDITASLRDRDILVRQALHDPLTGLFNRAVFMDRLGSALDGRSRTGRNLAVVLVDLDQFKVLNDSLGHHVGDEVLVSLAPRLTAALVPGDVLARLGGDEFVVLCDRVRGSSDALGRADRLMQALAEPVELPSGSHAVSASIGVAVADGLDATVTGLVADADAAMYRAKALGRRRIELFDASLRITAETRLTLERELRAALSDGQFCLEYQPVVNAETGQAVGVEALVRWNHPERGVLGPDSFIPLAEEIGAICEIGAWVLQTACAQLSAWQKLRPTDDPPFRMAVNVSVRQLLQPDFVEFVADTLRQSAVAFGTVDLEITESALADTHEYTRAKLRALKAIGARLLLDDFGTGYSSLLYLKRFSVDALKIDRSFVVGLGRPEETAIVDAVVRLAKGLELEVVAEGVENESQRAQLRSMGCHLLQGFLISKPLAPDQVSAWLLDQRVPDGRGPVPSDGSGRVALLSVPPGPVPAPSRIEAEVPYESTAARSTG